MEKIVVVVFSVPDIFDVLLNAYARMVVDHSSRQSSSLFDGFVVILPWIVFILLVLALAYFLLKRAQCPSVQTVQTSDSPVTANTVKRMDEDFFMTILDSISVRVDILLQNACRKMNDGTYVTSDEIRQKICDLEDEIKELRIRNQRGEISYQTARPFLRSLSGRVSLIAESMS